MVAGGIGEQDVAVAVCGTDASVNILCLFWVLVRKRWAPVLGQRPLENISFRKGQVLSMAWKTTAREMEKLPLVSTKS